MTSLMHAYERWVRREHRWLLPLIDTTRNLTLFLPGRYSDSEMRGEAIYTALNLLTVYHDTVLARSRAVTVELKCGAITPSVRLCQSTLMVLNYTEVLIEMATALYYKHDDKRRQRRYRWTVIAVIEAVKSLCRLVMLANNGGRMLVPPTQHEQNMRIVSEAAKHHDADTGTVTKSSVASNDLIALYRSHGRGLNHHPHGLFTLSELYVHHSESTHYRPSSKQVIAEILYIIRPLIYALTRLRTRDSSWKPWVLSLVMDVSSRLLYQSQSQSLSPSQRAELNRRLVYWLLYSLRSPFFEHYTQYPLVRVSQLVSRIPLVGVIGSNLIDLVFALQQHYFYISGS